MSKPVCKFYILNQTCRFGRNCRFLHPTQRPPPDSFTSRQEVKHDSVGGLETVKKSPEKSTRSSINPDQNEASVSHQSSREIRRTLNQQQDNSRQGKQQEHGAVKNKQEVKSKVCFYFSRNGKCFYGKNCRYVHSTFTNGSGPNRSDAVRPTHHEASRPHRFREPTVQAEDSGISSKDILTPEENVSYKPKVSAVSSQGHQSRQSYGPQGGGRRICAYFRARQCNRGRNCKFLHVVKSTSDERINYQAEEKSTEQESSREKGKVTPKFAGRGPIRQVFTFTELEEFGVSTVRAGEVNTIKKRFPHDKITVIEENDDKFSVRISFTPSDPDWPFDVKVFDLVLTLPKAYPQKTLLVKLPTDQDMPETVRRYVEITINEWLEDRHQSMQIKERAELVFRQFLRWLDRNMEEITTQALQQLKRELVAKAAGMEFLSPQQLREKLKIDASDSNDGDCSEGDHGDEDDYEDDGDQDYDSDSDDDEEVEDEEEPTVGLVLDPEKKGTQVELRHLQLLNNASSLLMDRLKLVLQCSRCKQHADLSVPQNKVMSVSCAKCHHSQFVHYRASLAHQFSSVVGYLDLDGCQAFDLVLQDCRAVVTCLACNKLTRLEGLTCGQMVDGWCQACHAKYRLATEQVKFTQLAPSGVDKENSQKVEVTKSRRPPKDPSIREGYPLPEFGTCKHYKHSYRWLRFPCCGKAYPCDVCHDKKEDHEFIYATRMICGHCCKEQNFAASRPCNSCSQHLTKIRSAHWEGGKGCRDKISMSKSDQQKYRNLSKTQSKQKKANQSGGKKNTKLRHA